VTVERVNRPLAAAVAMLAGMAIIGFTDNYVRVIAAEGGLWQFHLTRTAMALPLLVVASLSAGIRLRPQRWRPVVLRSFLHSTSMLVYFGCLAFMPVAEVAAGLFTAPIFVLLISRLAFGRRFGIWRLVAVLVGFLGVVLMVGPRGLSPLVVLPVAAAVLYGLGNIATREWCEGETTGTLTFGFFAALGIWGAVGLLGLGLWPQETLAGADGFPLRGWTAPSGVFLFWTLVQAVGSLAGVALMVRAYQLGEAGQVAVYEYSLLVFGAAWGWLLWGEVLSVSAAVGILLIALSGAIIALRSRSASNHP
jgi:drug/metabolite transporter (DMT)-like permease